jgi:hypothetical protein
MLQIVFYFLNFVFVVWLFVVFAVVKNCYMLRCYCSYIIKYLSCAFVLMKNMIVPGLAGALVCHHACWHGTTRFTLHSVVPRLPLRHDGTTRHGTACHRTA